jgi:hypothetical protein
MAVVAEKQGVHCASGLNEVVSKCNMGCASHGALAVQFSASRGGPATFGLMLDTGLLHMRPFTKLADPTH